MDLGLKLFQEQPEFAEMTYRLLDKMEIRLNSSGKINPDAMRFLGLSRSERDSSPLRSHTFMRTAYYHAYKDDMSGLIYKHTEKCISISEQTIKSGILLTKYPPNLAFD